MEREGLAGGARALEATPSARGRRAGLEDASSPRPPVGSWDRVLRPERAVAGGPEGSPSLRWWGRGGRPGSLPAALPLSTRNASLKAHCPLSRGRLVPLKLRGGAGTGDMPANVSLNHDPSLSADGAAQGWRV